MGAGRGARCTHTSFVCACARAERCGKLIWVPCTCSAFVIHQQNRGSSSQLSRLRSPSTAINSILAPLYDTERRHIKAERASHLSSRSRTQLAVQSDSVPSDISSSEVSTVLSKVLERQTCGFIIGDKINAIVEMRAHRLARSGPLPYSVRGALVNLCTQQPCQLTG